MGDKKWNLDLMPLISFLLSIALICWKIMKLIVVQCGCNDSSDIPSKFASFSNYRPNSVPNAETNEELKRLASKVTEIINLDEEGDAPVDGNGNGKGKGKKKAAKAKGTGVEFVPVHVQPKFR